MATTSADDAWLRRDKWIGFYAGAYAPHLPNGTTGSLELLPWRSRSPSTQLTEYVRSGKLDRAARAVELGCGTGENLVCLAGAVGSVIGLDIVPAAVDATRDAIAEAGVANAEALVVDLLALRDYEGRRGPSAPQLIGAFDFAFDCQTYHCLQQVVGVATAGAAVASLLRPGGTLLLLTGNANEPDERGPVRLTREELEQGLSPFFQMQSCEPFHFDETTAYRRQAEESGHAKTPLGWKSVWRRAVT